MTKLLCHLVSLFYGGISSGFAYITYTNILLPSINLLPPNSHLPKAGPLPNDHVPGAAGSSFEPGFFWQLAKGKPENCIWICWRFTALELLVKQVMMDDGWWWLNDGWMMDEWWMNDDDDDDDGWWMMDENPPNFRQCFLASWTLGSVFRGPEPTMLAQHKGIAPAYYETLKTTPDTPTWLHQQFQGQRPILRCRMQDPFIGTGNSCARFKVW